MKRPLCWIILLLATQFAGRAAAIWQWSVSAPTVPERRAFLWVPPDCKQVRGLVIACQNMIEKPLFERPAFRAACAENDLGIVLIFSGHDVASDDAENPDHPKRSALDIFLNPDFPKAGENPRGAGEDLQTVLNLLAAESGYDEIRFAPLLPVGHSSAGPFVWHLYQWNPERVFAMMPFKTGTRDVGPEGIPVFDVNSEWFDYGSAPMHDVGFVSPDGGAKVPKFRQSSTNALYGYYVDVGSGHCNASDDAISIMRLFLKKAVAARIPKSAPRNAPVALKRITAESGWLLDPAKFGKPEGKPVKYSEWQGDPRQALWYLDEELAAAVQSHVASQLAKKPQHIGFMRDGVVSTDARLFNFTPKFLDDAGTFRLEAAFVDHLTQARFNNGATNYYPAGLSLSHSEQPILFRVNSGALVETGSNTFRVCPHGGPVVPQGNPWEPTIVAYALGDENYRPTDHPAHVNISVINKVGEPQTLDFERIVNQQRGAGSVKLRATASSGLPVQFFVVSGPARVEGDVLKFDEIPVRAKFPLRVIVSAFQWGRSVEPKVQSAGPVTQEFLIEDSSASATGVQKEFRYTNPITHERSMAMRDHFIIKVGRQWFMTGTSLPVWTGFNPGVRLFVSDDLLHWRHQSWLIDASKLPDDCPYKGRFWAPEIHRIKGRFWLTVNSGHVTPDDPAGLKTHNLWLFVADEVTGPYKLVNGPLSTGFKNDSTLFEDDDGQTYIYCSGGGLWQAKIDLSSGKIIGELQKFRSPKDASNPGWMIGGIEGPFVLKRDGTYFMFFSTWTRGYEIGLLRAKSPLGPWTLAAAEPIFGTRKRHHREKQMREGGYADLKFDDTPDPYVEVGHNAVFEGLDGKDWLCCHYFLQGKQPIPDSSQPEYYDTAPQLGFEPLRYTNGLFSVSGPTWTEQTVELPASEK